MSPAPTLAPFALASVVGGLAVLAATAVAAAALVLDDPRRRAAATLAAPVAAVLALTTVMHSDTLTAVRDHVALAGAGAVAGLVALAVLTALVYRRPGTLALLAVAALPFRVPVALGGSTANLLLPLYGVIAAGCVAQALMWFRGVRPPPTATAPRDVWVRRLEIALAVVLVLYAVQTVYSRDVTQAAKNVCFFYIPFAVLFRLLLQTPWTARQLRWTFWVTVGLALVFAVIGFVEFATGRLLLTNTKVLEANELKPYFRVNSLFFDPNIYGRYLALTMVMLATVLLWTRRKRTAVLIGCALAVLWAGLVLSLSQSSFAALLAGLVALAALRWRPRVVAAVTGGAAVIGAALVLLAPALLHIEGGSSEALDKATSGRVELVKGAVEMFGDRPVYGFGSGAFQAVYRERERVNSPKVAAVSHTIPLTIAAEQGVLGLLAYVWLLVAAGVMLFGGVRPALHRAPPIPTALARAAVGAATCALVLHTLIYASFLEDPILWTLLAVGAALRLGAATVEEPAPVAVAAAPASA